MAIRDKRNNLEMFQGSTFRRTIRWSSESGPVDLTGYDIRMYIRHNYDSTIPTEELGIGSGITIDDPTQGAFTIELTANQTESMIVNLLNPSQKVLPFELYVYDLEYEKPDGFVDKLMFGSITLYKEVTYD